MDICYSNKTNYRVDDKDICDNPKRMVFNFEEAKTKCSDDMRCKAVSCNLDQEGCWLHSVFWGESVASLDQKR